MRAESWLDDLAIRDLVTRYCDAVNRRDEKAFAESWANDAEWEILGQHPQGRAAIVALWKRLMSGAPWVVQLPNSGLIELDGDRASGRWYITERFKQADGQALLMLGVYHDGYVRTASGWCFQSRRLDALYSGPPDLSGDVSPFPELG